VALSGRNVLWLLSQKDDASDDTVAVECEWRNQPAHLRYVPDLR